MRESRAPLLEQSFPSLHMCVRAGAQAELVSSKEEYRALAPLVIATLRALNGFTDAAFRQHLAAFFPLLTALIGCEHAPREVQRTLSDLFMRRIGPLLSQS